MATHHFSSGHTGWLMFISRPNTCCLCSVHVSHVCAFHYALEIHLDEMKQALEEIIFYQKWSHAHSGCVSSLKRPHTIWLNIYYTRKSQCMIVTKAVNTEQILNGDSRCQRMHVPSIILIRCHNQLLFGTTTPNSTNQLQSIFCFNFSRC